MKQLPKLSDTSKNILLMVAGVLVLLYAFGIFTCALNALVILLGSLMFLTGFVREGYWAKLKSLINKK